MRPYYFVQSTTPKLFLAELIGKDKSITLSSASTKAYAFSIVEAPQQAKIAEELTGLKFDLVPCV